MPSKHIDPAERQYKERVRRARCRIGESLTPAKCCICGHVFTDEEILNEDLVFSVGKGHAIQFCKACFKEQYLGGGKSC